MAELYEFKNLLENSNKIAGFTGAGISTESGISDYRSLGGIWDTFTPVYLSEFVHDLEKRKLYWQRKKALWESINNAHPGKSHRFFKDIHDQRRLLGVITQNIDGLHEKSGLSADYLINLHGTTLEIICLDCGALIEAAPLMETLDPDAPPNCKSCGGLLKPNTISFGQELRSSELERAERVSRQCDLMIAAGSTLQVQPAASFPLIAKEAGAKLVIITLSETPLDEYADFVFQEKLGSFFERLEKM